MLSRKWVGVLAVQVVMLTAGVRIASARPDRATLKAAEKERCAKKRKGKRKHVYFAAKSGPSIRYYFCDGTTALKRPDGSLGLSISLSGRKYDDFTHRARARLEVAEHNAKVLKTETSQREAAIARAAFERRVSQYQRKYGFSKKHYARAIKRTKIQPTE